VNFIKALSEGMDGSDQTTMAEAIADLDQKIALVSRRYCCKHNLDNSPHMQAFDPSYTRTSVDAVYSKLSFQEMHDLMGGSVGLRYNLHLTQ
jgi:hypothetical protein